MPRKKGVSLSIGRGEKTKKGGLTAKGRAKYKRATGSNLQEPVTEKIPSGKIFNFWVGHTNFDITRNIQQVISSVTGVEILDVFTRYRFRIAVAKAFKDRNVMNDISKAISNIE